MDAAPTQPDALRHSGAALPEETSVIVLVLAVLTTYRLATDLAWEAGPGALYEKWRGRVQARYGADDWRSEGVACPICISFWLSLIVALALGIYGAFDAWLWPLYWLGIAGAVAFLARLRA